MEEDLPSPFIKRKSKVRPSGSTSSLRSLAASSGPSTLSFANDEGDDEDAGNVAVVRARGKKTPAGRVKEREGTGKAKGGRLSFGAAADSEDDGDTSFTIKKSDSRRLLRPSDSTATLRDDALSSNLDKATLSDTPAKSIYSKEYLNELKAGTLSTPPPARGGSEYDDLTRSKFGAALDDMPAEIPTTAAIAEAKERRERMRAEGGGSGNDAFISLEVGLPNKRGESRLVREDDEIGDGDEDLADFTGAKEKVPLGQKANREAAAKMRSGMVDMIQDAEEDDDDEEAREWENAQIRRGEQRREESQKSSSKRPYKPTPIPHTATLPSMSGVSTRLSTALETLQTSHTLDSAALEHFAHERAELDSQEKELREEVIKVEEKNRWFGEFKTFVEEIAAFLDEKHPLLEKIESENLAIQKERYDIVSRRRYEDDSDDVALFTGASIPSTFFLVPTQDPTPAEPEVDELGRTRPDDTAPRSAVRTARRSDRERRLQTRPKQDEEESTWTDDDLGEGDSADLADALTSLREKLLAVFADVKADDFRDPNLGIRKKFEEWREKFNEEYENAFGGLALVGVWEFWARVEMALWNPFEIAQLAKTPPGLDAYRWHVCLSEFGHSGSHEEDDGMGERPDESETVINALVTTVVIPRLEILAKETFDPMSRKQSSKALAVLDEVSYSVERSSPRFESLVRAFLTRFQLAITQAQSLVAPHLSAIALPQNAFDPSMVVARNRFANRQYKLLLNAIRWRRFGKSVRVSSAGEGLGGAGATLDELITRELVAKVILPVVEAGWQTGGDEIGRKVLAALPAGEVVPQALRNRLAGEQ